MFIQLILSLILFFALIITWRRARQNAIRRIEAFAWSLVWGGTAAVVWYPNMTTRIAHAVGVGRGADLMLYGAVIVLLLLVFHLHVAHDRLERQLTELIREQALRDFERDQSNPR